MRKLLPALIGAGLLVLAVSFGLLWWHQPTPSGSEASIDDESPPPPTAQVVALGTLEPAGGVIDVTGPVGDRLDRLDVKFGDSVTRGQVLAIFHSYALRKAQLEVAKLTQTDGLHRRTIEQAYGDQLVAEAELAIKQLALGDLDLKAQESRVAVLRSSVDLTRRTAARWNGLDVSIVSPQERDEQEAMGDKAQSDLEAAEAMLIKGRRTQELAHLDAEDKLAQAKVNRERLVAAIDPDLLAANVRLAEQQLEASIVRAPVDGRVLELDLDIGETAGQMPMLRIGDTDRMYVSAEVYEAQVFEIEIGDPVEITSQALRKPLVGKVESVGMMVGKNQVVGLSPTSGSDLRVVKVRIAVEPSQEAARLVNLQVRAKIDTRRARSSGAAAARTPAP